MIATNTLVPIETLDCELCIVGAGYAGLNGLNAAAKYLMPGQRVVVIDENTTWGGNWLRQYDFVRLHQPYRMFTAGDQPWTLQRDPSHLATKSEVLEHLASVPSISAGQLEITPLFAHRYVGHRVQGGFAEIDVVPLTTPSSMGQPVRVRARRLLKATGFEIPVLPAFDLSSKRVFSVGVADGVLSSAAFLSSDAPVYVIGSGKTAMDCVRQLLQQRRKVHVIAGSGMYFLSRDSAYPRGVARYVGGTPAAEIFLRMAAGFDGHNESQIAQALARDELLLDVFGNAGNCRLGIMSRAECDEIRAGVLEVHRGHLVDVDGTELVLREGRGLRGVEVEAGAWFVNCTSSLLPLPHEPLLQDGGITCAPQTCAGFSGTSSYFLTHLWFRDRLAEVAPQLFRARLDMEPKLRFFLHGSLMVLANMLMIGARLPPSVAIKYRGDFLKWYPLHRQLLTLGRMLSARSNVLRTAERLLTLRFSDACPPALSHGEDGAAAVQLESSQQL